MATRNPSRPAAAPRAQRFERGRGALQQSGPAAVQRAIILALPTVLVASYWTGLNDTFSVPKFTVLLLAGVGLAVATGWEWLDEGAASVAKSLPLLLLAAVVLLMAFSSVLGDHVALSFVGDYGRNAGVLTYAAGLLLLATVLSAFRPQGLETLASAVGVSALPLVVYGLAQALSFEPIDVDAATAEVFATLGQANFLGGVAGILLPFLAWAILRPASAAWFRVAAGAMALCLLAVAQQSSSFQALASVTSGLLVFVAVWSSVHLPVARRRQFAVTAVVIFSVVGIGFGARIVDEVRAGLDERVLFWQASANMIEDRPILGSGLSGYASKFTSERPRAHAVRFGLAQVSDAPHNVPLGMGVAGGVLLGLAYLAFVVTVGVQLARGLRHSQGEQRVLLGTFGAGWLAYQAQSLVSIDVPVLIVFHILTAGAILLLTNFSVPVRLALPVALQRPRRGHQTWSYARAAAFGVLVVAGLLGAFYSTLPWRADAAYTESLEARARRDDLVALDRSERATSLAPWTGLYWAGRASALAETGDQEGALVAGERASDEAPSAIAYHLSVAQLADRLGRTALAESYFERAIRRDPYSAEARNAKAEFLETQERYGEAILLRRRAVELRPAVIDYRLRLAELLEADGQHAAALEEYRRILDVDPENPTANAELDAEDAGS